MHTKLRIRGNALISGNVGLLILVLATASVVVLSSNLSVLIYEIIIKVRAEEIFGDKISFINLAVSSLLSFFTYSIYSQIKLGIHRFFLRRAQKKGGTAGDIFYYFHPLRAVGAISFSLKMLLLKSALLIVSFVPFTVLSVLLSVLLKNDVSALVAACLLVGDLAFLVCGAVFYGNIKSSFFLAKYCFIDGRYISFSHLLASSQQDMKNERKNLLRLKRSFSGWFLLCLTIIPIGYVWSYYNQTMALAGAVFMKN